jgi:hypothetical protein
MSKPHRRYKPTGGYYILVTTALLLLFYLPYVAFVVAKDQGPVDYETFMRIGGQFNRGEEVYGENSYYPLPYVMVFGLFAALPRPLSMAFWLMIPVFAALIITGWRPWVLLFAPLFGHFLGGQTAVFGMLGLWGYRKGQGAQNIAGGAWLALTLLKPQLGLIPLGWAAWQWWKAFRQTRRIPRQAWAWAAASAVIYLPAFILQPDWVSRWLSSPRPLFERALAGLIPRSLILVLEPGWLYWGLWLLLAGGLLITTWLITKRRGGLDLDILTIWYFIASPVVHDYDLIQLIPLLEEKRERWLAVLLGLPTLSVILFAYGNDAAWFVITLIAPGLWLYRMLTRK